MIPRAGKRDAAEAEIVSYLRSIGASVQPLSLPGVPDLLVGFQGRNLLMEVKTGREKLTEEQREWHRVWRGQRAVVRNLDEAIKALFDLKGDSSSD